MVALSQPEVGLLQEGDGISELKELREKLLMGYEEVAYEILDSEEVDIDTRVNRLAELLYSEPTQELYVERVHLKEAVNKMLLKLTPREERVLRMRFFPKDINPAQMYISDGDVSGDGVTLEEVADLFGLTRERIRQMEARALRRLRHPSRSKDLRGYL